ncbi:hypothetical protein CALVIDRAFT_378393 [Calocera viscosa TUFC12733]|uniref:Transmembrane protein n=1 Tax=Calocera viscosa (strain TUFC12733) TaxID=1330018 RepID=A0A167Q2B4_CALVF|nr:hypothetical protein CALVIDRAFT_378393 [Calocera viscosa TUFC12733]
MVWGKRWIFVVFNVVLWLGIVACSVRLVHLQASYMHDQTNLSLLITEDNWTIATVVLSFTSTTLATGLVTLRIWKIDRASPKSHEMSLLPVVQIVVESGCLYTSFLLAYLVALVLESPALLFLNQIVAPLTSIAFFLIIVRVGMSKHGGPSTTSQDSEPGPSSIAANHEFIIRRTEQREELSTMEDEEMFRMKEMDTSSSSRLHQSWMREGDKVDY